MTLLVRLPLGLLSITGEVMCVGGEDEHNWTLAGEVMCVGGGDK